MAWMLMEMVVGLMDAIPFLGEWREERRNRRARASTAAAPVVAAAPASLRGDEPAIDRLPLPIRACQECGSVGVRPLHMGEGGIAGVSDVLDASICPRCGHQGLAVEFDRHADYRGFLRRIALTREARARGR